MKQLSKEIEEIKSSNLPARDRRSQLATLNRKVEALLEEKVRRILLKSHTSEVAQDRITVNTVKNIRAKSLQGG